MLLLNFGTSIALLILTFLSLSESQLYQNETELAGQTPPDYIDFINATMSLMAEGERKIILDDASRDIILVVGMSGAGKTTITKFIAEIENLESYSVGTRFLIRDKHGKISEGSTIVSKTIFPQRIIDNSTQAAFYDMPGFGDTRNVSIELANSWFMKKVADHAHRVKILIVVSHSALLAGEHRDHFLKLLSFLTDYVKDPEKFKDSISLVVSKVQHPRGKPRPIAPGVVTFLENVKRQLESVADPKKLKPMTDLINALLSTDSNGSYTKIASFKQPRSEGPLLEMPEMLEQRSNIKRIIYENTKFVDTSPGDFRVSVSAEAINLSSNLTKAVTLKLQATISSFQERVQHHFQASINNSSLQSLGNIMQKFQNLEKIPSTLINDSSTDNFVQTLIRATVNLGIQGAQHALQEIRSQKKCLEFFAIITGNDEPPSDSSHWNTSLTLAIESTRGLLQRKLVSANENVTSVCESMSIEIRRGVDTLEQPRNKEKTRDHISALSRNVTSFIDDMLVNAQTFNGFASKFRSFLSQHGLSFDAEMDVDVNLDGAAGNNFGSILNLADWLRPFIKLEKHLRSEFSKLTLEIHSQRNQHILMELVSNSTSSQKRLTDELNGMKLRIVNLRMEAKHESQVWKDRVTQEQTICLSAEQSLENKHAQKIQHIRDTHAQRVSALNLEIQQEIELRVSANATSLKRLQELKEAVAEEKRNQEQTLAALEKVSKDGFTEEEKQLQETLNQANQTCLSELDNLERRCQNQMKGQELAADQKGITSRLQFRALESKCERDAVSKNFTCQQTVSALKSNIAELRRIGEEQESSDFTCDIDNESKLELYRNISSEGDQSIRELVSSLTEAGRRCEDQVNGHIETGNREVRVIVDSYEGLLRDQRRACERTAEFELSGRYAAELEKYRIMALDSINAGFNYILER